MPETRRAARRRQRAIARMQSTNTVVTFTPGKPINISWPQSRLRADESLAVEDLRRAYYDWKMNRRRSR